MLRASQGCDASFQRLVVSKWVALATFCVRLTGDSNAGDDLAQHTWVRIYERRKRYRAEGAFLAYARTIAHNSYLNWLKARKRAALTPLDTVELAVPAQGEQSALLLAALRQLHPEVRMAFVYKHYYEHTYSEVAALLGVSVNTAKSRVSVAIRQLSKLLGGANGQVS